MKLINRIYSIYGLIIFLGYYICSHPFIVLFLKLNKKPAVHWIIKSWGHVVTNTLGLHVHRIKKFEGSFPEKAIYCANHTSYFDIPCLFVTAPEKFTIVGKSELNKVPLFGYMFQRMYIPVNRKSAKGRYETYKRATNAIDEGKSVIFYPEGTIPRDAGPTLHRFKDGPFKIAIEKQIPIVPVTIPYNWIILPDNRRYLLTNHRCEVIYHEPVPTEGLTIDDMPLLKEKTFNVIQKELNEKNK